MEWMDWVVFKFCWNDSEMKVIVGAAVCIVEECKEKQVGKVLKFGDYSVCQLRDLYSGKY